MDLWDLQLNDTLPNCDIVLYVLLGEDAFALKKFIMEPYLQQKLAIEKRVYN